jgi:hypothetical protein
MVLLLVSTLALSRGSLIYAAIAALQILCWTIAIAGLRYRIPALDRVAAPASALLVLKAAAVVGLYRFLFTRGPLWKIWNSYKPSARATILQAEDSAQPESFAATQGNDRV